jgi:hypothetical protein
MITAEYRRANIVTKPRCENAKNPTEGSNPNINRYQAVNPAPKCEVAIGGNCRERRRRNRHPDDGATTLTTSIASPTVEAP